MGRPFGDMELSKVRPLSEFVYVKEDGDILDHDPIIGVLHFGQTPSTGKFLAGTSEDLSTETNCYF